jgi:hypothetical protein
MAKSKVDGVVVLLPGILGSRLSIDGTEVWGPSAGAIMTGVATLGKSVKRLTLDGDAPDAAPLKDGVTATGLMPDLHLIPGLWKIEGYTKVARTLKSELKLEKDQFHEFPYDWRRDIRSAAHVLSTNAPRWLSDYRTRTGSNSAKLILLGHSQGGLVARYFLECLDGWRDTEFLFTFGTPYQGSLNPVNFMANGFKKKLGPVQLVDLTGLARSLTSLYQMMPSYPFIATHDADTLARIADLPSMPGIVQERAIAGRAFHQEIEDAVADHLQDERYRNEAYKSIPIVGRFQPTLQSGRLDHDHLEFSQTFPGKDFSGDGTVPEVSATPLEDDSRAVFVREKHSEIQNWSPALDHVVSVISRARMDRGVFRGVEDEKPCWLAIDDAFGSDEPLTFSVGGNARLDVSVTLHDYADGRNIDAIHVSGDVEGAASFYSQPPGAYVVRADFADGNRPITDVVVVAPADGRPYKAPKVAARQGDADVPAELLRQLKPIRKAPMMPPPQMAPKRHAKVKPEAPGRKPARRSHAGKLVRRDSNKRVQAEPNPAPYATAYAVVNCDSVVVRDHEFPCEIGLGPEPAPDTNQIAVKPPEELSGQSYKVDAQVVLAGLRTTRRQKLTRTLTVSRRNQFPTFELALKSDGADPHARAGSVGCVYSILGRTIALIIKPLAIVESRADVATAEPPPPPSGGALEVPSAVDPADLTVTIMRKVGAPSQLQWRFHSPHQVDLPQAKDTDIGMEPLAFAQQLIDGVNRLQKSKHANVFENLRGQGRTIGDHLPGEFWEALEKVRSKIDGRPSILFLSQEPYVPWELALTDGRGAELKGPSPFLGAHVDVARWVVGSGTGPSSRPPLQPDSEVTISSLAVIAGQYGEAGSPEDLAGALDEAAKLQQRYSAILVNASYNEVDKCLKGDPRVDLIHFATHGRFTGSTPYGGLLLLDAETLDSQTIRGYVLRDPTFVFLNCCQVGTSNTLLGDYAGMASAFLDAGAAGVVAALWDVPDQEAKDLALDFYAAVFEGESPSSFLRRRRATFLSGATSAISLAYLYFGHPNLSLMQA